MRITTSVLAAAMLAAMPFTASAQMMPLNDPVVGHPDPESLFTSTDPLLHRNKQAALHIMRELLQCGQWSRAGEWLTDRYIQHNPLASSGLEGVVNFFVNIAGVRPTPTCDRLTTPIVAVQAEGDYVTVVIGRTLPIPGDPNGGTYTTTWFDSWRFVDGKADQHWDPATLPNYTPPGVTDADTVLREAQDRAAIEALMWTYVRAADTLDANAYAAVFTENGSFNQVTGRQALRDMITGMEASMRPRRNAGTLTGNMHHIMSNMSIEFVNPNRARVHYYWQTVFGGPGVEPVPRVAAVGNGVDDVVRLNGRWLIESRNVQPTREQE
jgi:predicted SnoaL-like aldol condensation-catalyzing enzyme